MPQPSEEFQIPLTLGTEEAKGKGRRFPTPLPPSDPSGYWSIFRRNVSGRNSNPSTTVAAATTTGYHRP